MGRTVLGSRGAGKIIAGTFLTMSVITLLLLASNARSQTALTADSFFTNLIENRADLTQGIAVFDFKNPTSSDLTVDANSFKIRTAEQSGATLMQSITYSVLENVSNPQNVTDYVAYVWNETIAGANGTYNVTHYDRNVTGWHWYNVTSEEWKEFTNYTFEPGIAYKIKVYAVWPPKLGLNSREWFPQIIVGGVTYEQDRWDWWNSSWNYKIPITINNSQNSNTLTNYQVPVNITYSQTNNHAQSDWSDMRFVNATDSSTAAVLPYWTESQSNSNWVYVWVKVDSIPASSSTTIYAYYGNSTPVSNQSNASAAFDFYNNGSSMPDWTQNNYNTGSWSVDVGAGFPGAPSFKSYSDDSSWSTAAIHSNASIPVGSELIMNAKAGYNTPNYWGMGFSNNTFTGSGGVDLCWNGGSSTRFACFETSGTSAYIWIQNGTSKNYTVITKPTITGWSTYKIRWLASRIEVLQNGTSLGNNTNSSYIPPVSLPIYLEQNHPIGGGWNSWWDEFRVRKYSEPEPVPSIGQEQTFSGCNGSLVVNAIAPTGNIEVVRNQTFVLQANATCTGGCCGNVQAVADPRPTTSPEASAVIVQAPQTHQGFLDMIADAMRVIVSWIKGGRD